ncbi:hypothetical protein L596_018492 [Steinernema carpocapsae]|uniref:Uncharacterized protein n=1 Tax=Steinernema carpocapsae TaxID=34508 RepID=A0A4U5N4U4_STECR|nr:hypothetical protein L596_018492 [Steinernema carpocapsae]
MRDISNKVVLLPFPSTESLVNVTILPRSRVPGVTGAMLKYFFDFVMPYRQAGSPGKQYVEAGLSSTSLCSVLIPSSMPSGIFHTLLSFVVSARSSMCRVNLPNDFEKQLINCY